VHEHIKAGLRHIFSKKPHKDNHCKQALPGKEFYLVDGRVLKDIKELSRAFTDMTDNVFLYHVNMQGKKNDFARWIKEVLEDPKTAAKLEKLFDKKKYSKIVHDRAKEFSA
jgi:hypothetical protein